MMTKRSRMARMALACCLGLTSTALGAKTPAQIITEVAQLCPDNTQGTCTPAGYRQVITDIANSFLPLFSAAMQGSPTAPTPPTGDNSTRIATTQFVQNTLGVITAGVASLGGTGGVISLGGALTMVSHVLGTAAITGDVAIPANGTTSTLATVNSNTGACGSGTAVPTVTLNGKGLATACTTNAVVAPAGTLTGAALASGVTSAPGLVTLPTITTGLWQATAIGVPYGGTGQTSAVAARQSSGLNIFGDVGTPHGDANLTIGNTERFAYTNASLSTARTWTLPAASVTGSPYSVEIADLAGGTTGSNTLTIGRGGSDTINGGTTVAISAAYGAYLCTSDGAIKWACEALGPAAAGSVTSITAGSGLCGGTISTSGTISICANGVANSMLATVPAGTTKCNATGSTATPTDCTGAQAEGVLQFTQAGSGALQRSLDAKIKNTTITPEDFGAAGSGQNTTGTILSSSTTLALTAAKDFANGQGIRVNHAGAAFTINQPGTVTVTPTGGSGTLYAYTIASLDAAGGVGQSIANGTTSTGAATLTGSAFNTLTWSAPSGTAPTAYAVYGNKAGSLTLIGITTTLSFVDIGSGGITGPDWVPAAPQTGAAIADWLVTTISSGGGTNSLTLAAAATTAATTQNVIHDDTAALNAAIALAATAHTPAVALSCDTSYNVSSAIVGSAGILIRGCGTPGYGGTIFAPPFPSGTDGYTGSTIVCSPLLSACLAITTDQAVTLEKFGLVYPVNPYLAAIGISVQAATGNNLHQNSGSILRDVLVWNGATGIQLKNLLAYTVDDAQVVWASLVGIRVSNPNYAVEGDSIITHSKVYGWSANFSRGIDAVDPSGLSIVDNKVLFGNGKTDIGILIEALDGSVEPLQIANNSVEGPEISLGLTTITGGIATFGSITGGSGGVNGIYQHIALTGGTGTGATANITISGNAVTAVTVVNPGQNYVISDSLSATVGSVSGFSVPVATVGQNTINTCTITGNEFFGVLYNIYSSNSTGQWVSGCSVIGNTNIIVGNGASGLGPAFQLDNWQFSVLTANVFTCSADCSASTAITLGSHTLRNNVQSNLYYTGFTTQVNDSGTSNSVGVATK